MRRTAPREEKAMPTERTVKVVEDAKGRKLLVEVTPGADVAAAPAGGGDNEFQPVGAGGKLQNFTNTLSSLISDTTGAILDGIEAISRPSKVQVEFGVELGAEGSVWFVAKGSLNSTIKVAIEWTSLGEKAGPNKPQQQ